MTRRRTILLLAFGAMLALFLPSQIRRGTGGRMSAPPASAMGEREPQTAPRRPAAARPDAASDVPAPRGEQPPPPAAVIPGQAELPGAADIVSTVRRSGASWERVRLVHAGLKYDPLRVVEKLSRDAGGRWRVDHSEVTAAGHVIVGAAAGAARGDVESVSGEIGARVIRYMGLNAYVVEIPVKSGDDLPRVLAHFAAHPEVARYAEADRLVPLSDVIPNDPQFGSLWGLHNYGQSGGTTDADIDAPAAWAVGTGSRDMVVGIIDTGADLTHPDLASNLWVNPGEIPDNGLDDDGNGYADDVRGWNFVGNTPSVDDDHYHGTHVSGTIGAIGDNGIGVAGVCWRVTMMPLKVFNSSGNGFDSDAAAALIYVHTMRTNGVNVRVTNNSYGDTAASMLMLDVIVALEEAGVLFVAAAGNGGQNNDINPHYPASFPCSNIIAVANTDRNDGLASGSCYGTNSVDLGAPGTSIQSTWPGGGYSSISGTSMSSPHVAGAAALIWSLAPWLSMKEVRDLILERGDPKPSLAGKTVTGRRLNVASSVAWIRPAIEHAPPHYLLNAGSGHEISARMMPGGLVNTNALWVFWNTNGSPSAFSSNLMVNTSNDWFRAVIPTQELGTVVSYWILGRTMNGLEARSPSNAPASLHSFEAVPAVNFIVGFSPDPYGPVAPDYGMHQIASGAVVHAAAAAATTPENGSRRRCAGWTGGGSVPQSGASNEVDFIMRKFSNVSWQWVLQYELRQTSNVPGLLDVVTWWDEGSEGETISAPGTLSGGGTNWSFAGWYADGARQPDPTNAAANPDPGFVMTAPRAATALYMPSALDSDADQIADWWEIYNFGSLVPGAYEDPDGDGFINRIESLDRTDPRNSASIPTPPVIQHAALPDPMPRPGSYQVAATVTDNCAVASVTLSWSLNYGPFSTTNMTAGPVPQYMALIPAAATNGDHISYLICARDPAGREAFTAPRSFNVAYAVAAVSPGAVGPVLMQPSNGLKVDLTITNSGVGTYLWQVRYGFNDDIETGASGWSHGGSNDWWHIGTNRHGSGSGAWHLGSLVNGSWQYAPSSRAELRTPMTRLFSGPRLRFQHWIECELDGASGYTWDGGIVEISTDGANFAQIFPVGDYPYKSHYYQWPQFAPRTPCYAGTGGWQEAEFDLSAYENTNACFRFVFASDDNTQSEGWYIDDVMVVSEAGHPDWVRSEEPGGSTPPFSGSVLSLLLNTTNILTGDSKCHLIIDGDDPARRFITVPVSLMVRSPPLVEIAGASQTSTNGEGLVSLDLGVWDRDGDPADLAIEFSADDGASWTGAWIRAVEADVGEPAISNNTARSVRNVGSSGLPGAFTNNLRVAWASTNQPQPVMLCANVLLRVQAADLHFAGSTVTSAPFMVDNEPPAMPGDLEAAGLVPGAWTTNSGITAGWLAASDGAGVGIGRYECALGTNSASAPVAVGVTSNLVFTHPGLWDGTNWVIGVRAKDRAGNAGPWANAGPFWVDATPPSPAGASVSIAHSKFGAYAVGSPASGSWSGFADGMSGLAGYYFATENNGGGTTNGQWTTENSASFTVAADSTNTLFVWARDVAGGIGMAAATQFLVVDPAGDFDKDGYNTEAEEIAGTDASDSGSMFEADGEATAGSDQVVISWQGISNRVYDVLWAPGMTNDWNLAATVSNVPGATRTMSFTDHVESVEFRFYRVNVREP